MMSTVPLGMIPTGMLIIILYWNLWQELEVVSGKDAQCKVTLQLKFSFLCVPAKRVLSNY